MRKKIIAANWKMNGCLEKNSALLDAVLQAISSGDWPKGNRECLICPPAVYLAQVSHFLKNTPIQWGAQNMSEYESGAYTGEISADMLKDFGCRYVLVGHSERRTLFSESSERVAQKFLQAKKKGLIPVLCVGETQAERQSCQTEAVIGAQIDAVLKAAGTDKEGDIWENAVIAYEPVWAIGTGLTATPEQAQEVHAWIREKTGAENLSILYGGSVKASNAQALFEKTDIDGALVGGASLIAEEFVAIMQAM